MGDLHDRAVHLAGLARNAKGKDYITLMVWAFRAERESARRIQPPHIEEKAASLILACELGIQAELYGEAIECARTGLSLPLPAHRRRQLAFLMRTARNKQCPPTKM